VSGSGGGAAVDLVIGLGNPLRGDDGVGWWRARRARRHRPAPQVRLVPQLTPELALELATARRVLFVDAWCWGRETATENGRETGAAAWPDPLLRALAPAGPEAGGGGAGGEPGAFSHALAPARLLALTALLQGASPPASLLLVPAFAFPHGAKLSEDLRARLPAARRLLEAWLADA
jgi:hydrogenase maturation protease